MSARDVIIRALGRDVSWLTDIRLGKIEPVCQSPIEAIFGTYFSITLDIIWPGCLVCCDPSIEKDYSGIQFLMMPQYPWQAYRIDWAFRIRGARRPYVFIECDGHDFHERTKDQAEHDRRKDRTIQAADITILRFTGRELYRDPSSCVEQVLLILVDRFEDQAK